MKSTQNTANFSAVRIYQLKNRDEIELILNEYDNYFNPVLSDVTNIRKYAEKLSKLSQFIVLKNSVGKILGFAAYYRNDPTKKLAFITLLAINKEFRN
ncbi:MAG TPA: hypothetical protein O0X42_01790, partial [Methanocorpusculum sp.]|nr:hypothetical protein [Methanocorpusculum sp.]